MALDWNFVLLGATQICALCAAYYGLKADNAALAAKLTLAMLTETTSRQLEHANLKEAVSKTVSNLESLVAQLTSRVNTLESGANEWTKALRERTHDLANELQALVLKVDRLERPDGHD